MGPVYLVSFLTPGLLATCTDADHNPRTSFLPSMACTVLGGGWGDLINFSNIHLRALALEKIPGEIHRAKAQGLSLEVWLLTHVQASWLIILASFWGSRKSPAFENLLLLFPSHSSRRSQRTTPQLLGKDRSPLLRAGGHAHQHGDTQTHDAGQAKEFSLCAWRKYSDRAAAAAAAGLLFLLFHVLLPIHSGNPIPDFPTCLNKFQKKSGSQIVFLAKSI